MNGDTININSKVDLYHNVRLSYCQHRIRITSDNFLRKCKYLLYQCSKLFLIQWTFN